MIVDKLKDFFTAKQRKKIKRLITNLKTFGYGNNLNKLATIYGTDKWGGHFYTQHYETHFRPFKNRKIKLLEIGVGGYKSPIKGGESLYMWKRYFPFARIYALDIINKSFLEERRIKIFQGSQVDKEFLLNKVIKETGKLDLIIDDGSHINEHVIESFSILFPLLKEGGIYAIEDTQTSYWPRFGGDSNDLLNASTTMNFFKNLADCLNHVDVMRENYTPSYMDKHIISLHFYHNMIFIYKGRNDEHPTITNDLIRIGNKKI